MSESMFGHVVLSKDHIQKAFSYLEEIHNLDKRNVFFNDYLVKDVEWKITGVGHSMAGTRHSVEDHIAASFARLRVKLQDAIRFVVQNIILESDTRTACVELKGYATRLNGEPYDNDYVWITYWNEEGKIFSIRSYHDTHLAEAALNDE